MVHGLWKYSLNGYSVCYHLRNQQCFPKYPYIPLNETLKNIIMDELSTYYKFRQKMDTYILESYTVQSFSKINNTWCFVLL